MLTYLRNKKAQAIIGEYALLIFLVLAAMTAITVYFKRGVQARIRDARYYMATEVRARTEGEFEGNLYRMYEPYYVDSSAESIKIGEKIDGVLPSPGLSSGIYDKKIRDTTEANVTSSTLPPKDFNITEY